MIDEPKLLKGARQINITISERGGFTVQEGDAYMDELTWDEMLGEIATLTHPALQKSRYGLRTETQHREWRESWSRPRYDNTSFGRLA